MHPRFPTFAMFLALGALTALPVRAQNQAAPAAHGAAPSAVPTQTVSLPSDYVIGPDDVLSVVFWRDKDMSADVVVRPDGNISLPLLNDIKAAGYTPDQLRTQIIQSATKFIEDPTATVVVKEIHSRNVYITGNIGKPGRYALSGAMNVMQLIALAGGLAEYADREHIVIIREGSGKQQRIPFNYKNAFKGGKTDQNPILVPGDTVVVP